MQTKTSLLNPEQMRSVKHIEGPMLVLAGAGSGKTRIVIERILHLLQIGVPSSEILAVTFTNKAAEEMKQRILSLANAHVLTSTFHSISARILRESIEKLGYGKDFIIADEDDSEKTLRQCFLALSLKEDKSLLKSTKKQISAAKSDLLSPEDLPDDQKELRNIYSLYQSKLKQYNALDFDDLLFLTVKLFQKAPEVLSIYQNRWQFILIDEYQDTNHAQYLLIKLLSATHRNVFAVGDPDQSIYSWRGANIQNILNFEKDYEGTEVVRLEQNYRSSNNILEAANALIRLNEGRYEKNLWSQREGGEKIGIFVAETERREADFVVDKIESFCQRKELRYKDCAIFYRTNFQSRTFEDALLRENIPYVVVGSLSFYQRREIKDILSLLRMVISDTDFIAFSRTINQPKRGLGHASLEKIRALSTELQMDIFPLCSAIVEGRVACKLSSKQKEGLKEYVDAISALRVMNRSNVPLSTLLPEAIDRSSYLAYLKEDKETYEERKANIEELTAKASEWEKETETPSLTLFLEELALRPSSGDQNVSDDCVKLMTLHSGKGLEFPLVFLVGMEEDLFPHLNSKDSQDLLEEERRICYVGLTRAKDYLFLTAARYRFLWGSSRVMRPSRFLKEIPHNFLKMFSSQGEETYEKESSSPSSFNRDDYVFHREFGKGQVQKAYQTSLGTTYDVLFFRENRTRSLAAKYAKLISAN
jgi:DNA helicase II / ATP-dependent DNA helicase PcrA